jgi:hypothetical protein
MAGALLKLRILRYLWYVPLVRRHSTKNPVDKRNTHLPPNHHNPLHPTPQAMSDHHTEVSATQQRLDALVCWLCDFSQLEAHHERVADFDDIEIVNRIVEIAEEICDGEVPSPRPTCASQAWAAIHSLTGENGLAIEDGDPLRFETLERQSKILCALLCHALSDRCEKQRDYVGKIIAMGRSDVQQEIMRIIQESEQYKNDDDDNDNDGTSDRIDSFDDDDLILNVDEERERAQHRADMLQVESRFLRTMRDLEEKYTNETLEQKREIEMLRNSCESLEKRLN